MSASDRPIDKFQRALPGGYRQEGPNPSQFIARCPVPGHGGDGDHDASFAFCETGDGDVVFECYAGCRPEAVLDALGLTWRDKYANPGRRRDDRVSLSDLAFAKRLPTRWLRETLGVGDLDGGGVGIPYRTIDGKLHATKSRFKLKASAKGSCIWEKGKPVIAYGLWRLPEFRKDKWIIVHEGETNAWALWYSGFPSIGIPGAKMAHKHLTAEIVEGMDRIYIWRDHGTSGREFVAECAKKLAQIEYPGEICLLAHDVHDDPSDWFRYVARESVNPAEASTKFAAELREFLGAAPGLTGEDILAPVDVPPDMDVSSLRCEPGRFPPTDLGNGERLVALFGENIRYCGHSQQWYTWDKTRWRVDDTGLVMPFMTQQVVRSIRLEARDARDDDLRTALEQHAARSENKNKFDAVPHMARFALCVVVGSLDLDAHHHLVNTYDKTIDLRTGEAREPDRLDLMTRRLACEAHFDEPCPVWDKFLMRIMGGDQELVDHLEMALGYSLSGEITEQCFFYSHGFGANGKTTLVELITTMMGDYAAKVSAELFIDRQNATPTASYELAKLVGVRFVSSAEISEGGVMNEARVKDLSGMDQIVARSIYKSPFTFWARFKIWMYGNHRPKILGVDEGIWRRIRLIPFNVSIPKSDRDRGLPAKLEKEMPAILGRLIRRCQEWYRTFLPMPEAVRIANQEYREDMDPLHSFIEYCCDRSPGYECYLTEIYEHYREWAEKSGQKYQLTDRGLGQKLVDRGYPRRKTNRGCKILGIKPGSLDPESYSETM